MTIARVDHVSIAVPDYARASDFFEKVLGAVAGYADRDRELQFDWGIFTMGDLSRLEILSPSGRESFLDGFLKTRPAGGVHHITLQTPDIQDTMKRLRRSGIPYFGYNEYEAFYWKEIFIHPKDAFGVLFQIAELNSNDWLAASVKLSQNHRWLLRAGRRNGCLSLAHPGGGTVDVSLSAAEMRRLAADLIRTADKLEAS